MLRLLGLALRVSYRMHVASLVGMLVFLLMLSGRLAGGQDFAWMGFWSLLASVAFNTLWTFVEGIFWALRVGKRVREAAEEDDDRTPVRRMNSWSN